MPANYRYILPTIQTALAAAVMAHNPLPLSVWQYEWQSLDWLICSGVNAPATLVAQRLIDPVIEWLVDHYPVSIVLPVVIRLSAIWLLWYLVAVEIGGRGSSALAQKTRLRKLVDLAAISFAGYLVASGAPFVNNSSAWTHTLMGMQWILWALVIVGFYGHDLWVSFRREPRANGST